VKTAAGPLSIAVPRVGDSEQPFRCRLVSFRGEHNDGWARLAMEMHARRLSPGMSRRPSRGDRGQLAVPECGVGVGDSLGEEWAGFAQRDPFGVRSSIWSETPSPRACRHRQPKEAVLCCWAILGDGSKLLLHLAQDHKRVGVTQLGHVPCSR
jgi:hypothetical protein